MVASADLEKLLDDFRFQEAEELVGGGDSPSEVRLRTEIERRREAAEGRARDLQRKIAALAAEDRQADLVELAEDSATERLLALLPDSSRKQAETRLRAAERWKARRVEINARRMGEARRAVDGLDLELARGLMKRIDGRFLAGSLADERDNLLLEIAARGMEVEAIEASGRRLVERTKPRSDDARIPWWRRLFGRTD